MRPVSSQRKPLILSHARLYPMNRTDESTSDCGDCGQGQLVRTHSPDLGCRVHEPRQRGQGGPIRGESRGIDNHYCGLQFPLG